LPTAWSRSGVAQIHDLLSDKTARQGSLFEDPVERAKSTRLMSALDEVNQKYDSHTLYSGACGIQ